MAEVTVFVDDAVQGHLPNVCAKDGVATTSRLRSTTTVGSSTRSGVLWLLLFVGPLGWLVLLVLLAARSPADSLTVELPFSNRAYARYAAAKRLSTRSLLAGFAGAGGLFLLTAWANLGLSGGLLTVGVVVGALVVAFVGEWRRARASVAVELDASRRWVTLGGVHPDFAAACREWSDHSLSR